MFAFKTLLSVAVMSMDVDAQAPGRELSQVSASPSLRGGLRSLANVDAVSEEDISEALKTMRDHFPEANCPKEDKAALECYKKFVPQKLAELDAQAAERGVNGFTDKREFFTAFIVLWCIGLPTALAGSFGVFFGLKANYPHLFPKDHPDPEIHIHHHNHTEAPSQSTATAPEPVAKADVDADAGAEADADAEAEADANMNEDMDADAE